MPSSSCVSYVQKLSENSVDIGNALGRAAAISTLLKGPGAGDAQLASDLQEANRKADALKLVGTNLGAPPVGCAVVVRDIQIPGFQLGGQEGKRAAYMSFADRLSGDAAANIRNVTNLKFDARTIAEQRLQYEAEMGRLSGGTIRLSRQQLASR